MRDTINRDTYAEDLANGQKQEIPFRAFVQGRGNTILRDTNEDDHLLPVQLIAPDLMVRNSEDEQIWIDIKWEHSASYWFKASSFQFSIAHRKWWDYLWLDQRHSPVYIGLVLESSGPPEADRTQAAKMGKDVPDIYPTGVYMGRVREMHKRLRVEKTEDGLMYWFRIDQMVRVATIEEYRA